MALPNVGPLFVGRYRMEELLGEGGSAAVYRATDLNTGVVVAVKILRRLGQEYHPDTTARFEREVRIMGTLEDPHTVRLLDSGRAPDGLLYIVSEFVEGTDLSRLLRARGTLEESDVLRVMTAVLHSLREAHAAGLLHRDIKPENIRVTGEGESMSAKLLDFGIATSAERRDLGVTQSGVIIGTPRYMSPEQLYEEELTPASDIYSLGIVGHEMLVGRDAMHGNAFHDQVERRSRSDAIPLPPLERGSPRLRHVLHRMVARSPERRPQTADEVLAELGAEHRRARPTPGLEAIMLAGAAAAIVIAVVALTVFRPSPDAARPRVAPVVAEPAELAFVRPSEPSEPALEEADARGLGDAASAASSSRRRSRGCGVEPQFVGTGSMTGLDGLAEIEWTVHVPSTYDPERAHPLVVLFHQDAEVPQEALNRSALADLADAESFVIVAPRDETFNQARAWREASDMVAVNVAVEGTLANLCVDPARIFAVGQGGGGTGAERAACEPWVAAVATLAYRAYKPEFPRHPDRPVASLHIAPLNTRHAPADGGPSCSGRRKISIAQTEALWRQRNGCRASSTAWASDDAGQCVQWECRDAPFVSCRVDGGHGWPGSGPRLADVFSCDGKPTEFPVLQSMWRFFESVAE